MPHFSSRWLVAAACTLTPFAADAQIDHVRGESWLLPSGILPSPQSSLVSLTFDADVHPTNDPEGSRISFTVSAWPSRWEANPTQIAQFFGRVPIPEDVSSAHFVVELFLACDDASGRILVTGTTCKISYMRPNWQVLHATLGGRGSSVQLAATFGLRVLASDGYGANPTSDSALYCDAGERSIGIWFDSEGTRCHGTIQTGTPGTVYVLAKLGAETDGMAGAEFRFVGIPSSWSTWAVPNPALICIGNPLGDGIVAGLPCARPVNGLVALYTVTVLALRSENDVVFTIEKARRPTNPQFQCPLIVDCDDPVFTSHCIESAPCFVNATGSTSCAVVGVEPTSWSAVKRMYD